MTQRTNGPPSAEGVATVRELAEAIGRSHLTRVRQLFAPDVRLRALTPRGIDDAYSPEEAAQLLGYWAESYDLVELVEAAAEVFGTRTLLRYCGSRGTGSDHAASCCKRSATLAAG